MTPTGTYAPRRDRLRMVRAGGRSGRGKGRSQRRAENIVQIVRTFAVLLREKIVGHLAQTLRELFGDDCARCIHLPLTGEEARLVLLALYSSTEPEVNELIQRVADAYHSTLHLDRVAETIVTA